MIIFKPSFRCVMLPAVISSIISVLIALSAFQQCPALAADDPLPSWNDGAAKQRILAFVQATTAPGSPQFVPDDQRIATFDQDGTLWVEQPLYAQAVFAIDRVKALASQHPEWKKKQPYRAILKGDPGAPDRVMHANIEKVIAAAHSGMTVEEFDSIARDWLARARHPRFNRPYTELVYQPMLELLQYLRARGFQTYIVTGGPPELVRTFSKKVYGVEPQQVIGSPCQTRYGNSPDGKPALVRMPVVLWADDREGKPIAINLMIGRQPIAAGGNSNGDRQMLEWTQAGNGARLIMLVQHDDPEREYDYGAESRVGNFSKDLLKEAQSRGWTMVSMKNDWKRIFSW